jgi:hypothetical protein
MRLSTYIESDSFQIGVIADAPVPCWDEKSLKKGITTSSTGLLLATYPDLDFRKRSIAVTALDADDDMTTEEQKEYSLIGKANIKAPHKTVDVGCIPTICDGTSGRLKFDSVKIKVEVYGNTRFEPTKLIIRFPESHVTKVWASRD